MPRIEWLRAETELNACIFSSLRKIEIDGGISSVAGGLLYTLLIQAHEVREPRGRF